MIYTAEELKIKVINARLMTRDEFMEHEESIPSLPCFGCWWLSDVDENDDDYAAYVEGDYTEEDMFCRKDEGMTFLRTALEIIHLAKILVKNLSLAVACLLFYPNLLQLQTASKAQ